MTLPRLIVSFCFAFLGFVPGALSALEPANNPSRVLVSSPPDYYFGCDPFPIPTEPVGPTLQFEYATNGDAFDLVAWRFPCSEQYSYIIFTIKPDSSTPGICSNDIVLVQDDRQSSSHYLTQDPVSESNAQCGDVIVDTSFAFVPAYYPDVRFNLEESFDIYWDLGDNEQKFTMFAYNPNDYEESDFPPDPGLQRDSGLNGMFYDPSNPGHGFNVSVNEAGLVIYYYGQSSNGELLWLVSELYEEDIEFNAEISLPLVYVNGTFGNPAGPTEVWGSLTTVFYDCDHGIAKLDGEDGAIEIDMSRLVGLEGLECN